MTKTWGLYLPLKQGRSKLVDIQRHLNMKTLSSIWTFSVYVFMECSLHADCNGYKKIDGNLIVVHYFF